MPLKCPENDIRLCYRQTRSRPKGEGPGLTGELQSPKRKEQLSSGEAGVSMRKASPTEIQTFLEKVEGVGC